MGAPIVKVEYDEENEVEYINPHSGVGIANNIWNSIQTFGVVAENYIGCSFDGQYHHQKVPHHLNQLFGFEDIMKPADWDPMHKAGIHISEKINNLIG